MFKLFKTPLRTRLDKIKEYKKLIPRKSYNEMFDSLSLPEYFKDPAVLRKVLDDVEKKKSFVMNQDSMAFYTHALVKTGLESEYIRKEVEKGYEYYKGVTSYRSAYGFYLGCLGLNYKKKLIYFARDEYTRFRDQNYKYHLNELVSLIQVLSKNTVLTAEEKRKDVFDFFEPVFRQNYQSLKRDIDSLHIVSAALIDIEYQTTDLTEKVLNELIKGENYGDYDSVISLYEKMRRFKGLLIRKGTVRR